MKEFEKEELEKHNGKEESPTYIAHNGMVYDVSDSKLWKGGTHMRRHRAGGDLTADIQAAPHGLEVLDRYPQVGTLKRDAPEVKVPQALERLLQRIPMLRRHPHPMTVHFPIVFMFSTAVFTILYVLTGVKSFEITALHCLGAGILFTPVAILTGLYTWWLNYFAKSFRAVTIKKWISVTMLVLEIVLFVWRIRVPLVLDSLSGPGLVYFLLVIALIPMVTVIGWFGASLTFPTEGE